MRRHRAPAHGKQERRRVACRAIWKHTPLMSAGVLALSLSFLQGLMLEDSCPGVLSSSMGWCWDASPYICLRTAQMAGPACTRAEADATAAGLVLEPLPTGAWAFLSVTTAIATNTLSFGQVWAR